MTQSRNPRLDVGQGRVGQPVERKPLKEQTEKPPAVAESLSGLVNENLCI